ASQKLFTIDSKTGTLKVKDVLDYETAKQHQVKVTASDGKLSAVKTVTVNVENVNEAPVWSKASETVSVKENQKGASIPTKVTASDPDGDALTYAVSDDRFEIDNKGNLKLKAGKSLDYETEPSFTLKVTAKDGAGLSAEKTVKINVANDTADDAKPEIAYDPDTKTISFKNLQPGAFKISADGGKTWEDDATDKFPDSEITKNPDGTVTITHPIEQDDEDWGDLPEKVNVAIQQNGHQANLEIDNPYPDSDQVRVHLAEDTGISATDNITSNGKLVVEGVEGKTWQYSITANTSTGYYDTGWVDGTEDGIILSSFFSDQNVSEQQFVSIRVFNEQGELVSQDQLDYVLDRSAAIRAFYTDASYFHSHYHVEKDGTLTVWMRGDTYAEAMDVKIYQDGKLINTTTSVTNGTLNEPSLNSGGYNNFVIVAKGIKEDTPVEMKVKSYDSAGNEYEESYSAKSIYDFHISSQNPPLSFTGNPQIIEAKFEPTEDDLGRIVVKFKADETQNILLKLDTERGTESFRKGDFSYEFSEDASGNISKDYVLVLHNVQRPQSSDGNLKIDVSIAYEERYSSDTIKAGTEVKGKIEIPTFTPPAPSYDDVKIYLYEDAGFSNSDNITHSYDAVCVSGTHGAAVEYSIDNGETWSSDYYRLGINEIALDNLPHESGHYHLQLRLLDTNGKPIAGTPKTFDFTFDKAIEYQKEPEFKVENGKFVFSLTGKEDLHITEILNEEINNGRFKTTRGSKQTLNSGQLFADEIAISTDGNIGYIGYSWSDVAGNTDRFYDAVYVSGKDWITGGLKYYSAGYAEFRIKTNTVDREILISVDGGKTYQSLESIPNVFTEMDGDRLIQFNSYDNILPKLDASANDGYRHCINFKFADDKKASAGTYQFYKAENTKFDVDFESEIVHLDGYGHYSVTVSGKVTSDTFDFAKMRPEDLFVQVAIPDPMRSDADAYNVQINKDGSFGGTFDIEKKANSDLVDALPYNPIQVETLDVCVSVVQSDEGVVAFEHNKEPMPDPVIIITEDSNGKLGTNGDDVLNVDINWLFSGYDRWSGYIDGKQGYDTLILENGKMSSNHLKSIEEVVLNPATKFYLAAEDIALNADEDNFLWIQAGMTGSDENAGIVSLLDEGKASGKTVHETVNGRDVEFSEYQYTISGKTYGVMIDEHLTVQNGGLL
ncbi:MAG: cadherin repeat domain-containing protein, partial [Neisseriaceae bacterium]|nr:cadherin repeat domain-containing protein [Neisseriaceae bacterium]